MQPFSSKMLHMRHTLATLSLCLLMALAPPASGQTASSQAKSKPPATVPAPGFTVNVTYSAKALETLNARKETVIVAAYVDANPKKGIPPKLVAEDGQIALADKRIEIKPGESAVFDKLNLNATTLKYVDDYGPELLINVFSGRRSSGDNLLDCGIEQGPLKDYANKTLTINCKLIAEK